MPIASYHKFTSMNSNLFSKNVTFAVIDYGNLIMSASPFPMVRQIISNTMIRPLEQSLERPPLALISQTACVHNNSPTVPAEQEHRCLPMVGDA